ncbi:hypothetical protein DV735_g1350, partial [Chaetothyriales sp. CBS 134920]
MEVMGLMLGEFVDDFTVRVQSFEQLTPRAVAVVVDPIQSVKGKVRVREENELTKEQLKTRYVGKVDPKKHIEDVGQQLIEDNIVAVSKQMIDKEASVAKKQEHTNGHSYTNGSTEMEEDLLSPMVRPSWKLNLKNAFPVPEDRDPRRYRDPTNYDGDFVRHGIFPFLSLPPELRNRIYYLTWFGTPAAGHADTLPPLAASDRGRLNLSLVCKRLHLESTHLLYSSTSFRLFPLQDFLYLPTPLTLPPHYRTHITTLSLIVGSSWTDPPSAWRVGKAMTRCLSRMKLVHTLKIFIEVDPSVPMFAGFRRSETFYTEWCAGLVRDVLKVLTSNCQVVEVDGNSGLDPHGQLSTRIVSEVDVSGRRVRWGPEWADKVKRIEQRRAHVLAESTTVDELADQLAEMELLGSCRCHEREKIGMLSRAYLPLVRQQPLRVANATRRSLASTPSWLRAYKGKSRELLLGTSGQYRVPDNAHQPWKQQTQPTSSDQRPRLQTTPQPEKEQIEVDEPNAAQRPSINRPEYDAEPSQEQEQGQDAKAAASIPRTDSQTAQSEPEPSEPQAPLPDLTKGIPSTFAAELEQAQSKAKARKSSLDITEDHADAVPGADGDGPRDRVPRSEYVSSSDRKKQIGAKGFYAFLALAVLGYTAYLGRNWESEELEKKHAESAPSGWGLGLFWNRAKTRWHSSVSYYSDPVTTKLLPDEEKDPAMRMPFTLVLSLDDLLIHSEWTRATGWRIAKRPGLDYFLRYLSQYYELVLFTTQPYASGEQVMRKLDPYMMIRWPLYREATLYQDGGCVKDLSYLNRDLKKVLIIDTDPHHVKNQPENAIILPPWKGDPKDQTLIQLIPFLEYLATMGFDDARTVLKSFEGKSIPEEFARREKLLREKFLAEHPQKAKAKRSLGLGSIFKQQSPDGLPSLEQAQAEGKMVWDVIRERGQRNYLELEKRIQEEGAKFLAEREAEEKRMNEEAMKDFQKGGFITRWISGGAQDRSGDELGVEEAPYEAVTMAEIRNGESASSDCGDFVLPEPLDVTALGLPGSSPNQSQPPSVPSSSSTSINSSKYGPGQASSSVFAQLPGQVIQRILWAVDANTFASASLLNREWYLQAQSVELYAHHLSRCPSYALSNPVLTGPFRRKDDLQRIKTKFAVEVRRNLFEAYLRPRQTVINLISINANSSAAFPGGEVFRFAFSPNGQIVLALSSSRIYVLDVTKDQIEVQRELKTLRRPLSASITDDGTLLAVLSSQHQANIYALTSQGIRHLQVLTMENAPRTIALAHQGTVLAAAYEGGVEVFSLTVNALSTDRRAVRSEAMDTLQFSGDGSMLVGSSQSLDEPNAVVITAPFYTENDPDVSAREIHSRMWTTQILFPQISSICSHAELLQGHTEGDANWLFAYDHSLMNFRAVRTDDTRTGVAYFLNPPTSHRFSLPCPNLAPTASACGTLVVAGFAGSGLQMYGIPERLDLSPDMGAILEQHEHHSTGSAALTTATGNVEPLMAYSPSVSGTGEDIEEDMDSIAAKVDWRQSLFVKCRGLFSLEGYSAAKWVEKSQRRRCEFAGKRLVVVAPGGVNTFGEELGDEAMPVDGSRLCLLDFDYGPSTAGNNREITIEVGEKEPELLPEHTGDIATEVALERRRTVRGLQGRGGGRLTLLRSTTATGPPMPSDYFTQAQYRPSASQPCSPSEQPTYTGSPLSLTPSTSQLSLHRSATMGGYRAARFPPRPPLGSQQYEHGARSPPRAASRASWETPPPPYSGGGSLVPPVAATAAMHQQSAVPETPPVITSATISGNNGTFDHAIPAHVPSIPFSRQRGTGGIQLEPVTEGLPGSRVLSEPYTQSPVAQTAGLSLFGPRAESRGTSSSNNETLGLRSTITHPFSPPLDQEVALALPPPDHRPVPNSITLTGTNLQNRLNHPVPPTPTELTAAGTSQDQAQMAAYQDQAQMAAYQDQAQMAAFQDQAQMAAFSPVASVQDQRPNLDQDSQSSAPVINASNSPNSLLRNKSNRSQRSMLGSSSTPNLHTHPTHQASPRIVSLANSNVPPSTADDQVPGENVGMGY